MWRSVTQPSWGRSTASDWRSLRAKNREPLSDQPPQIQFKVTPEVWSEYETSLTTLVESVYEAWRSRLEEDDDEA